MTSLGSSLIVGDVNRVNCGNELAKCMPLQPAVMYGVADSVTAIG